MPKATRNPLSASRCAFSTSSLNRLSGSMRWSEARAMKVASDSPRSSRNAAAYARAGAVLRATGSGRMTAFGAVSGGTPRDRHWRTISGTCDACVTTMVMPSWPRADARSRVVWKRLWPVPRSRNCLGKEAFDAGQRRVPEPPAMITTCLTIIYPDSGDSKATRVPGVASRAREGGVMVLKAGSKAGPETAADASSMSGFEPEPASRRQFSF